MLILARHALSPKHNRYGFWVAMCTRTVVGGGLWGLELRMGNGLRKHVRYWLKVEDLRLKVWRLQSG